MKVKICGITNLEDALASAEAGADYLGFIFYAPSKRSVAVSTAVAIASSLRARPDCPLLVGVFVNESPETMAWVLDEAGLDLAQLSGEEVPSLIGDSRSPIYGRSYKALRPTSFEEAAADADWFRAPQPVRPSLLIDSYHATLRGGTGTTGDWALSARLAETIDGLMLAGGLTPDNVAEAVARVRPFAVDVASGVEAAPGKKDVTAVRRFVARAKDAARVP